MVSGDFLPLLLPCSWKSDPGFMREAFRSKSLTRPRPLVQHAELIDGRFTFSNCSDLTLATKTFAPFQIEFGDISKFLDRKGPHIIKAIR